VAGVNIRDSMHRAYDRRPRILRGDRVTSGCTSVNVR